jgi:cholesterol oxidase
VVTEHVDVVVVGSGFGGSVTAQRLADGGREVVVLERGRAYPPGSFPRSPAALRRSFWDPASGLHGMFHLWSFRGLEAMTASGLGGGSLIYANVLLRKDERWFVDEQPHAGGTEHWPVGRADLDPHYDRVEAMLGATRFPYPDAPKTAAMRAAAEALGHEWSRPPLAVSFRGADGTLAEGLPVADPGYPNIHGTRRRTCRLCGECDVGCNDGAKNTLDHTYLSAAAAAGADVRTGCEVRRIRPGDAGGYVVEYVRWLPEHEGVPTDAATLPHEIVHADRVVLGAGALGTPHLLLRNRTNLPALGRALGTRFCGNGDLLGLALRATHEDGSPRRLDAAASTVITSTIRVPDEVDGGDGRGFYLQDAGFPQFVEWILETALTPSSGRRYAGFAWERLRDRLREDPDSDLSAEFAAVLGDGVLSSTSMPLLGMGRDVPDGTMTLRDGHLDVDWTTDTSMVFFERVRQVMQDVAGELGAEFHDNLLWLFKRVITVHPLGGAPMGRHVDEGVVDPWGEAWGHPGLHVVDGAAMPGPVGPNPSLTIAAFADRAADRILEADEGTAAGRRRPAAGSVDHGSARAPADDAGVAPGRAPAADERTGPDEADERSAAGTPATLAFTEEMKGHVALADTDFHEAARRGRREGTSLMFRLTIHLEDVAAFVGDPDHEGTASGWVQCEALGGRLDVERGWFNLFVDGDAPDTTRMLYRLWFADAVGNPLTLTGFKVVHDDPGFDTWSDTSTLYVRVLRGHVGPDRPEDPTAVAATGILTIHLPDFLQQLTTFRVTGPTARAQAAAAAGFGRLFLGELWEVYGEKLTAALGDDA